MEIGTDKNDHYGTRKAEGDVQMRGKSNAASAAAILLTSISTATPALADNLYRAGVTQSLTSDRRPERVGDLVTVIISESAQSSSSQQNSTNRTTAISAAVNADTSNHNASLGTGNAFSGAGAIQRTDSFVTQMTALVTEVLPDGDFMIAGSEKMHINGETTTIEVRGRIRAADINGSNQVQSNRIANAQVNYNGKGFVSRSAKPGIIQRIFSIFGL